MSGLNIQRLRDIFDDVYDSINGTLKTGGAQTILLGTFRAIGAGTGYSIDDIIIFRQTPPDAAEYFNATTGLVIATPDPADLGSIGSASSVSVTSSVLPAGAATEATLETLALENGGNLADLVLALGEIQATPTANTVLARLKAIADTLAVENGGVLDDISGKVALEAGGNLAEISDTTAVNNASLPTRSVLIGGKHDGEIRPVAVDNAGHIVLNSPVEITPEAGAVFLVSQSATPAYLFTSTIQRANNTTPYTGTPPDVYGAAFELVSSVEPTAGQFLIITNIEIIWNITALPSGMAGFAFYPYLVTPPSAIADNGAFSIASGDRASIVYPNGIPLTAALARGGGSVVAQANNLNLDVKLTGTSLFGYTVTLGSFTPANPNETATIRLRAIAL